MRRRPNLRPALALPQGQLRHRHIDHGIEQKPHQEEAQLDQDRRAGGSGIARGQRLAHLPAIMLGDEEIAHRGDHHGQPDQADDGAQMPESEGIGFADNTQDGKPAHALKNRRRDADR